MYSVFHIAQRQYETLFKNNFAYYAGVSMIIYRLNLIVVFFLMLNSIFSAFLYYFIITRSFKVKNKNFKLITTAVFFVLYGIARSATFLAPLYLSSGFWRALGSVLNSIADIGLYLAIFLIIKAIYEKIANRTCSR